MFHQDIEQQAALFSALADPTRLKLVKLLRSRSHHDALCVNALAGLLGVSQSAVSQHLRVLKAIGLVNGERRGYHIHYYINGDILKGCRKLLLTALSTKEATPEEICQNNCHERRVQNVS